MKSSREQLLAEIADLQGRLQGAEEALEALRAGVVDEGLQTNLKEPEVQAEEIQSANQEILAAYEALRESREDLQQAQAIAHIGSWRLDVGKNKLNWSEETRRIFGIPEGTPLTYETFLTAVHPEDREYVDRKWAVALAGEPYDIEHRIVVGETVKWVRERAELEFDSQGQLLSGFGTTQDITERKQAEEALTAAHIKVINEKKRLEAVMETLPVGVSILDERGGVIQSNEMFGKVWGSPQPTTQGVSDYRSYKAWWLDTGQEVQPEEWAAAQAVQQGKTVIGQMMEIERFDGVRRAVINSGVPIRDADGKITGCAVAIFDITEQRRTEEVLRESEERLRQAAKAGRMFAFEWNPDTDAIKRSPEAGLILGLSDDSAIHDTGQGFFAKILLEDRDVFVKMLQNLHPEKNHYTANYRMIRPDNGQIIWLEENARALFDVKGRLQRLYGMTMDISERKQAEEALRLSNRRLDLLEESASRLLASEAPQEVVNAICPKVMEFLDCDVFFNFIRDEQEERLHLNAWAGIPPEEAKRIEWLDYGVAVCGCAARDGSRIVVEDIQTTTDVRTELVKSYGIQAYACQPLIAQGRVLGTLSFGTRRRTRFNEDEQALMQAVADQVAVAMERKLFTEALWNSRERERGRVREMQAILEAVPMPIFLSRDPSGKSTIGNPAAYEFLHMAPGTNLSLTAPAGERPEYKVRKDGRTLRQKELPMQRALAGQRIQNLEYDLVLADGCIKHVAANAVPLLDLAGRPQGAVGALLDLTERQQALKALQRAHDELEERVQERTADLQFTVTQLQEEVVERLRAEAQLTKQTKLVHDLYNQAPCGYHSLDSEGRFAMINDTELAWLGYSREEVVGRLNFADLLTPEGQETFRQNYHSLIERGELYDLEYQMIRKDGTVFPVLLSATAVRDEAGNFLMSRGTVFDLTTRVQAEAALASERERLFQVLNHLPAYVLLLAPDYTVPYANREFIRRFGVAEAGQRCYEYLFGRDKTCEHCQTFRVLETNARQEWEWLGPDGHTYAVFDYPFTDVDGSPLILELGLDITARKRAEAALSESEEKLRYLSAQLLNAQESERKRIASELHDELGHALLTMKLQLQFMEKQLPSEQLSLGEEMESMIKYLDKVINNVRRLYGALTPGNLEDLGLTAALSSMIDEFVGLHDTIGWSLHLDNIDDLYTLKAQTVIYRIIQEILTNIGKHANASKVSVIIKRENQGGSFTIEDDGQGFNMEKVLASTAAKTGLGLPTMEERVRILGGSLTIWSQENQGTRITFTIPISKGEI